MRDIFKRSEANDNWENFSELLNSTPRGNFGNMGNLSLRYKIMTLNLKFTISAIHFLQHEIIPFVRGSLRWNKLSNLESEDLSKGVTK